LRTAPEKIGLTRLLCMHVQAMTKQLLVWEPPYDNQMSRVNKE
jgi:hypothetical protein